MKFLGGGEYRRLLREILKDSGERFRGGGFRWVGMLERQIEF